MSLSTNGSVPKFTPTSSQLSALKGITLPQSNQSSIQQTPPPPPSPTAGLFPGVNTASQQKVVSVHPSGVTTTTHPAQSNPSVLAQQQALNKLGAGLVEDGIAGPKTSAAISKYGSGSTTTSTPPEPAKPTTPQVGTASQNAQTTLNSGNQTPNESGTQAGVLNAGLTTPDEKAFQQQYVDSVKGHQYGQLAPYAESSMYAGKSPQELQGLISAPDLVGRSSADTGLYNALGGAYGNAALAGLTAAQTSAARNLQANTTAYSGAQGQAGRATGAAENVQNASLNQQGTYGAPTFNPLTGQYSSSGNYGSGPEAQSNVQGVKDAQNIINSITSNAPAITTNLQRANDLAAQAKLDPNSPLLTGLQHALSNGLVTNQGLIAFNSAIAALNQNLTDAGQAPIDPATITPSALAQLTQTIPNNLKATQQSKQQFINSFNSGSSASSGNKVETNPDGTLKAVSF